MRFQGEIAKAAELYEANFNDPATRDLWGADGMMTYGYYALNRAKDVARTEQSHDSGGNKEAVASAFLAAERPFARLMDGAPKHRSAARAGVLAGQLLLRAGDFSGAVKRLKAVADNYPEDSEIAPEALFWQCDAFHKAGQGKAARAALRLLIRKYPNSRWISCRDRLSDPDSPEQTNEEDKEEGEPGKLSQP